MNKCIFCEIAEGKAEAKRVYEDDNCVAFLDIYPAAPGHILVISKKHYADIHNIPKKELCEVIGCVQKMASLVVRVLGADGVNILQSNGETAGQVIKHIHFHVIPRFKGDKIKLEWDKIEPNEEIFEKLKKELK